VLRHTVSEVSTLVTAGAKVGNYVANAWKCLYPAQDNTPERNSSNAVEANGKGLLQHLKREANMLDSATLISNVEAWAQIVST